MAEVRNMREGTLRWVAASGSGTAWATASAPASGLIGFVTDCNFTSAQTLTTISNRGTPDHHKVASKEPPTVSFTLEWGVTGDYPTFATTGAGATVPMVHLEFKSTAGEAAGAIYHQFHGIALEQLQLTEGDPNTQQYSVRALAMVGPTASGFLG